MIEQLEPTQKLPQCDALKTQDFVVNYAYDEPMLKLPRVHQQMKRQ